MVWYWAGDKPSAEPMITQFIGHQASVCSKYQKLVMGMSTKISYT